MGCERNIGERRKGNKGIKGIKNGGKERRNEDEKEITFPQTVNVSVRRKFTAR
jgi:hypothetical protein